MSTRSWIGREKKNGRVDVIYCHWDGYPSHNGKILHKHYQDPVKVKQLIQLGALSSLREKVVPPEGVEHTYEKPLADVTIAYKRDRYGRKKKGYAHTKYLSIDEMLAHTSDEGWCIEFIYLFTKENEWLMWDTGQLPLSALARPKLSEVLELVTNDD